jgi:two-component system sensor histidine kinase BaeS
MKTKLFLAFLVVILIALVSNFIFRSLMQSDFEEYVEGSREDQLYWVLAALEGSYGNGSWERHKLRETVHWGIMLGFDIHVVDMDGKVIETAEDVLVDLEGNMLRRMGSIVDFSSPKGDFEIYPLYIKGEQIGAIEVREIERIGNVAEKERIFKKRGKEFLVISFLIAGGGAIFLSLVFSLFLTNPVKRLKEATETIAKGDFDVKVNVSSGGEMGQLARSFNFMSEALKREDMIRRHLASNIAHELRTPLTIMKANLEGLADGVVEYSEKEVQSLKEEVERLIRLVEGVENVTRAEASFLRMDVMEEINLLDLIEKNVLSVKKIAEERNVKLNYPSDGSLQVISDREKLNSIIKNLISNALKFTENGEIAVTAGVEDDSFYIEVSDSGRGMETEEVEHIFDRFYKGLGSKGKGIGLSIVKDLVDAMGGRIDVESAPGEGSRFKVYLPHRVA